MLLGQRTYGVLQWASKGSMMEVEMFKRLRRNGSLAFYIREPTFFSHALLS